MQDRSVSDTPARPPLRSKTNHHSGLTGIVVLILGLAGVVLWGSMLLAPYRLATGLLDAGDHLRRAQKALSRTELKVARYEALAAQASVDRARSALRTGGPALDLARWVGVVDDALGEVPHLISAAQHSTNAALGTLDVAQDALRGPRSIIVDDPNDVNRKTGKLGKKIDLGRLEEIAATIAEVHDEVRATRSELKAVNLDNIPKRGHDSILDALETAAEADKTLSDAQAGLKILPSVLGADGERTYMIGFQNTAEQRGTGGAILQFGFMRINDGAPKLDEKVNSVYDVDKNRTPITIPLTSEDFYVQAIPDAQRFGNANWSPDWPASAALTVRYAQATPADEPLPDIDGVIVVDPLAAQELMKGVGQFQVANRSISSQRIVDFMLYRAYSQFPIPGQRRVVLNLVVDRFYDGLFNPSKPTDLLNGFGDALSKKHVQIYMFDPAEQAFIERMDWDGGIILPSELKKDDYVYVVEQNVGGSKLDYFDRNRNEMQVSFEGSDALVSTKMSVTNGVFLPQPRYSMGDAQRLNGACATGRCPLHRPMMNLYVRDDAEFISASVEGDRIDTPAPAVWTDPARPPEHFERGKKVWSGTLEIPPGETASLSIDYRVPGVLQSQGGRSVYRLQVQHQPKVQPETFVLRIAIPAGATGVRAPGFERDGDVLVWESTLKTDLVLEVSWRK